MGNATTTFEGDLGSDPGRGIGDLEHKAQAFEDAFNAWDLDALLAMYEPDAIFVPEPGKVARGRTEIRQAFQGFVALKPRFSLNRSALHVLGDLALEWGTWPQREPTVTATRSNYRAVSPTPSAGNPTPAGS